MQRQPDIATPGSEVHCMQICKPFKKDLLIPYPGGIQVEKEFNGGRGDVGAAKL
jgi:hypothetical protein